MDFSWFYRLSPLKLRTYLEAYQLYWQNRETIGQNIRLKNRYKNKTCFVLTNGPSLLQHDLTRLNDSYTFALNHFSLHPHYRQINPKFYLALDPVILTRPLLFKHFYPPIKKANLPDTQFFFHINAKSEIESRKLFPNNIVHYTVGMPKPYSKMSAFDLSRFSQFIDNSPAFILMLAHYLGFKTIYILGSDFNTFLTGESHFYPNFRAKEKDPFLLDNVSVADRALTMYQILKVFETVGSYLKSRGVKIFNASDGLLDVFPRVRYEKIKI